MSNRAKFKRQKPQVCPDCAAGRHTGRPHLMDGTPLMCGALGPTILGDPPCIRPPRHRGVHSWEEGQ